MKFDKTKLIVAMADALMTRTELAMVAEVDPKTVGRAMRGESVRIDNAGRIAKALSVSMADLLETER